MLAQREYLHPPTPGAPRRTGYLAEGLRWTRADEVSILTPPREEERVSLEEALIGSNGSMAMDQTPCSHFYYNSLSDLTGAFRRRGGRNASTADCIAETSFQGTA